MIGISNEDFRIVLKDVGDLLLYSSPAYLIPLIVSVAFLEPLSNALAFFASGTASALLGLVFKFFGKTQEHALQRQALFVTGVVWLLFTLIASIPFVYISGLAPLHAYFEAMSMLTTTGITMFGQELNDQPHSIVFWRSFLGWVGGIGIIILALVGVLGAYVRSAKLSEAEGREERLRPHILNTLHEIWSIYAIATGIGVVLLVLLGMDAFSALNYAMSGIATNGAAPTHEGLRAFNSIGVEIVLLLLMVFGGIGFRSHYLALKKGQAQEYWENPEIRIFFLIMLLGALMEVPELGLRYGVFHGVSSATSGGFNVVTPEETENLSDFSKLAMAFLMIIGGTIGSTAGGLKIARFAILAKSLWWKVKESILPEEVYFRREFGDQNISPETLNSVYSLSLAWMAILMASSLVLVAEGAHAVDAMYEASSAMANVGLSTGISHQGMPFWSEVSLILAMWLGRLEIIPVFAIIAFFYYYRKPLE